MEGLSITNPAVDLGELDYSESLALQRKLVSILRKWGKGDVLLFLNHPPVYTVGRGKNPENYKSVPVVETERGGDVTYHGPGQLVVYPIMDLRRDGQLDVRKYVQLIEDVIIESIGKFGFSGELGQEPGIWVNGSKVASIGMAIRDGIAFHGFSINISGSSLDGFSRIRACGLDPSSVSFVPIERNTLMMELLKAASSKFHRFNWVSKEKFYSIIQGK